MCSLVLGVLQSGGASSPSLTRRRRHEQDQVAVIHHLCSSSMLLDMTDRNHGTSPEKLNHQTGQPVRDPAMYEQLRRRMNRRTSHFAVAASLTMLMFFSWLWWTGPTAPLRPFKGKVPLEAHIMSKCPDAKDCLHDLVLPAMQRIEDKVDFKLSFIGT